MNMEAIQNYEELPQDVRKVSDEISGTTIYRNATSYASELCYGTITRKPSNEEKVIPDSKLDYVITLIKEAFVFRSIVLPFTPRMICKEDLENPLVWNRMVKILTKDLLDRYEKIPRGNFTKKEITDILNPKNWFYREDFKKFNMASFKDKEEFVQTFVEKMYVLTLFIYDYVQFSFNEMKLNAFCDEEHATIVQIDGKSFKSNKRIDACLIDYITNQNMKSRKYGNRRLTDPERKLEEHPKCSIKNMTAMFCDLFSKFIPTLNLTKRSDAVLSDLQKNLVAQLAIACKICENVKIQSVFPMYYQRKNYFLDCKFYSYIRDNEYGFLILNDHQEEIFSNNFVTPISTPLNDPHIAFDEA